MSTTHAQRAAIDQYTVEIMRMQAPDMPEQARKAYQRAAIEIITMLICGRQPPLLAPPFGMNHTLVNDIIEAEIVMQRYGTLENEKLKEGAKVTG